MSRGILTPPSVRSTKTDRKVQLCCPSLGRAVYSMSFDSYAEVPKNVADEIIAKAKGE